MSFSSFSKGEIIWAKIKGFPWWPAIIGKINGVDKSDKKYKVDFIGENSQYLLFQKKYFVLYSNFIKVSNFKTLKINILKFLENLLSKMLNTDYDNCFFQNYFFHKYNNI